MSIHDSWPALPLQDWRETCDTIHMFAQVVGKIRLRLAPAEPEWAHVAMYVTPRGLTTGPIPFGLRSFQIDFDFIGHKLDIVVSDGQVRSVPLQGRSVASFYRDVMAALHGMGIDVRIWPQPVEVPNPIRFEEDTKHHSYDPEYVNRFMRILVQADASIKRHRAPFRRRHSLVQFFFGTFDLAYTRFSGRPATPPPGDIIIREAMDAEEICVGFWPGDDRFPEPAFWCYAFPKPPAAEGLSVRPAAAFWNKDMGEYLLRYEDVRTSKAPDEALGEFFRSTFEGFAKLAKWSDVT
jgi:Family of unknown function (DUF5996)